MHRWLRQVRAALGMGLTWGIGWGLIGGVMELLANFIPALNVVDMWPQTLAIPGFVCGVVFSLVLRVSAGQRRFDELSIRRFAAWGAMGGLLLGALTLAVFGLTPDRWLRAVVLLGSLGTLGAGSASAVLALARMGDAPRSVGAGADDRSLPPGD